MFYGLKLKEVIMFKEEFTAAGSAAAAKVKMLKGNPLGYFILSMLAGMFVGFGVLLAFSIGGQLNGAPATKVVMGASFGVALSLVVMAGAELFTGNNMVMAIGMIEKKVNLKDTAMILIACWLGNLAGGILLAVLYTMTGLCTGAAGDFIAAGALAKMSAGGVALFTRGILCNILVCLAVWCGFRCKTETAKLIMIFWCLIAFFTAGFEHSVANMTLLTVALINPAGQAITLSGWFWNMSIVTLGNMVGGIVFMAFPYAIIASEKKNA